MFIAGNVLEAIATILDTILWLYMWVIIIRALISWVNPDPWNPIVQFLDRATEPVLSQIRRRLPIGGMGFDFSPIVAILIIMFFQIAVVSSLKDLAIRLN
ncbi:MAG: YggT family protein [Nitrospirales bacterium]